MRVKFDFFNVVTVMLVAGIFQLSALEGGYREYDDSEYRLLLNSGAVPATLPPEEHPVDEEPTAEIPSDEETVDEIPVDEEPVAEIPTDEEPTADIPSDDETVDETPVDEASVAEEFVEYDHADYRVQLNSEVVAHSLGVDEDGEEIFYKVQSAATDYIYLGPNEVFFNPPGALNLSDLTENPDLVISRKKEFASIRGLRRQGESIEWGFITSEVSGLHADFFIKGLASEKGAKFVIQIDDGESVGVVLNEEMLAKGYFGVDFAEFEEGMHVFKVTIDEPASTSFKILNVRLSGEDIASTYVVTERWRPKAIYSKWRSSENPDDVKAWIMELYTDSELGHFSPLKGNSGYFGPIFRPGGSADHMNMSVWSATVKGVPLPLDQQSHILGIGSADGYFSYFTHEGTGVKVRGWDNFSDNTSHKFVIGQRYEDDGNFRTFYGYFWDENKGKWQLYSVARKLLTNQGETVKTVGFIEVLGGPERERSNHSPRRVNYRGWVRDSEGNWTDLDRLQVPRGKGMKNHKRGVSDDGEYFFASTGGLRNYPLVEQAHLLEKDKIVDLPDYMRRKRLKHFDRIPFKPQIKSASFDEDDLLTVRFRAMTSRKSTVTICWGEENAQSNERHWTNKKTFEIPAGKRKKVHTIEIPDAGPARFVRVLVRDSEAQMWSFESYDIFPTEESEE